MAPTSHIPQQLASDDACAPVVVITGVNLVEGGTLTVFREIVRAAAEHRPRWQVIALVHKAGLLGVPGVTEIAFEHIKRSWLRRMFFEWVVLARICRELRADVWLSAHDITPRVGAPRQFVYCHNPAPFSTIPHRLAWKDPTFARFKLLYGLLYGVNIHRNTGVIVQQQWIREEFQRRYGASNVIVAHPTGIPPEQQRRATATPRPRRFLYPSLPRVFKNIELIAEALALLEADERWQGSVTLTIDGSENPYAEELMRRCRSLRSLRFIGRQRHEDMERCYAEHDALLFPSLLETWGLPLTEARDRGLPILAADLPYAHESVGECAAVRFFDPHDAPGLSRLMLDLHLGTTGFAAHHTTPPQAPYAQGWPALIDMVLTPAAGRTPATRAQESASRSSMEGAL